MSDVKRIQIIRKLLEKYPDKFDHLFSAETIKNLDAGSEWGKMRSGAENLLDNPFSSGEKILLKVAIDIWNGEGGTTLEDLLRLSPSNFKSVMEAWAERYRL